MNLLINDLMIKSFLALTDTLNFTNAAKRLYLSQQAVSKHIAKLEDELECQLFFRSRGDISLTPAGKIYFNVFSQYIDNMANATILVRNMTGTVKHKLIIGHLEMLDIRLTLSSVVQKLKQRYPNIELEYRSYRDYELPQALHDNRIDLAITLGPEIQPDLIIRTVPLTKIQDFLFCAKDHPLAKTATSYLDFKDENVFLQLPPSGDINQPLQRLKNYGFSVQNLRCIDTLSSTLTAIEMLDGVSFAVANSIFISNYATFPSNVLVDLVAAYNVKNPHPELDDLLELIQQYHQESPVL